jgi:hypothetical protein
MQSKLASSRHRGCDNPEAVAICITWDVLLYEMLGSLVCQDVVDRARLMVGAAGQALGNLNRKAEPAKLISGRCKLHFVS